MATIDKHFMLTEEICSILRQRDKNRFPLERDFVSEAVKSYGEHLLLEQILKELREFRTWMEGKTGPVAEEILTAETETEIEPQN